MRYRSFPGADVTVSEVGFGTWTLATGWWGEQSDDDAIAMLRGALDEQGITFFDAADTYGNGRAERQLASAFKGRRNEVVIGTKVGYDIYDEAAQQARRGHNINTIQMIWNILEQHPGTAMIEAGRENAPSCCFNIRVTHASGMLEGKYTEETVFPPNDHRRHRPRSWLVNGVKKIRTLDFLTTRMTLGQAALKWLLAEPLAVTTLPNVYDDEQLVEFASASDASDLTSEEREQVAELAARNF